MCHKASAIGQKLTHLATLLLNQLQQEDASSGNKTDSAQQLHQDFDLMKIVDDVQSALRAGVSIQVRYMYILLNFSLFQNVLLVSSFGTKYVPSFFVKPNLYFGAIRKFLKKFIFGNLHHKKGLKGGISINADSGPPRYVL